MVEWRSGSAGALQAQGRGFKSLLDHHKELRRTRKGFAYFVVYRGIVIVAEYKKDLA